MGHSTYGTHEVQFTHHIAYYSICEDSCKMFSVALEGAFPSLRENSSDDVIRVIVIEFDT